MIGLIAAMDVEMESLRSHMENPVSETISGICFVSGTLEGRPVVTAVCGIGKVFAALCAQTMILRYSPEAIINTGVAGTLTDALSIGAVAVSSAVVQHDMDTSALGDPVGMISGINKVELPADDRLCGPAEAACAKVLGIRTQTGVIASGDQFIAEDARKEAIACTFHAIACEMEGAAIGQVCWVNRVPLLCASRHIRQCGRFFPHGLCGLHGDGGRAIRPPAAGFPAQLISFSVRLGTVSMVWLKACFFAHEPACLSTFFAHRIIIRAYHVRLFGAERIIRHEDHCCKAAQFISALCPADRRHSRHSHRRIFL